MRCFIITSLLLICFTSPSWSEESSEIEKALQHRIIEPDLSWQEVQTYTESRVLPMPEVTTIKAWEKYIEGRRQAVFNDVIFRGEAANWRDAEKKVVWLDTIEGGPGYKIRKLRYEAIPGLWIPAVLYEPDDLKGKVPVVMNVNGHDGSGKVAEYKQLRCINHVKRGMLVLNVEWLGMGQLRTDGFSHYKSNQIDLCGTSGIATHFLYMTRGLDILLEHPHADPKRVAVAGLSGGGWQTIFITSLDSRVTLSNPVAGYSSFKTRARFPTDLGDSEQTPVDLGVTADYSQLTAMRAPRPTLLTFNAEDNCCFKADHAPGPLVAASQPIFDLYNKSDNLRTHVNTDPGTHNFGLDNRQQLYKMMGDHFFTGDADFSSEEIASADEIKTKEQLNVELPEENLDFHTIALNLMKDLPTKSSQSLGQQRDQLKEILRLENYEVHLVQSVGLRSGLGIKQGLIVAMRLKLGSDWTIPATKFNPVGEANATVILLSDEGRGSAASSVTTLLAAGKRVIAIDPFYFGESKITKRDFLYGLLVSSVGERPLGIQTAQVSAVIKWVKQYHDGPVEIHALGKRTGLIALTTAALKPELLNRVEIKDGFSSLKQIIKEDMNVSQAPELFCFGLLESFDIPQLEPLAKPCVIEKQ